MDSRSTPWFQRYALASLALGLAYFVTGRLGTLPGFASGLCNGDFSRFRAGPGGPPVKGDRVLARDSTGIFLHECLGFLQQFT